MKRLFQKKLIFFSLVVLLTNCKKDDPAPVTIYTGSSVIEYSVSVGVSGGYLKYLSIFNNSVFDNEPSAAFVPLKDCKLNQLKIKVINNSLNSNAQLTLRQNGANTAMSITIPQGQTGYFSNSQVISLKATDEINYFLDTSSNYGGQINMTIGVAIE